MVKKYKYTGKVRRIDGVVVKQIVRISDGKIGGWIQSHKNLSHDGDAWVDEDAVVFGSARISGDAWAYGNARIFGRAQIFGDAEIFGDANVYGDTDVSGHAQIYGHANVFGSASIHGNAQVYGSASVYELTHVHGNARVYDNARVLGTTRVAGSSSIWGEMVCTKTPYTAYLGLHYITCSDGHVSVGCQVHAFSHWLAEADEIGRQNFYRKIDIDLYSSVIFSMIKRRQEA